jgi:formamidopyrimidine-DNA glycosylase
MPELPDVEVYVEAIRKRVLGHQLTRVLIRGPFLLRSTDPPLSAIEGRTITGVRRVGKRIALGFDSEVWLALHLMIAGRLHWRASGAKAGAQHRAALHIVSGEAGLRALDAGGIEVLDAGFAEFRAALISSNHTLKRSLTDPRLFSGIGNAYSDEILHRARLSPLAMTIKLTDEEIERLYSATRETLLEWVDRLRAESRDAFPEKVTAFREGMAVHGRYRQPCPRCGAKVQRIRYAANETNYCPQCQTGGRLLADRALSRLLREDWPRTPEELESLKGGASAVSPPAPAPPLSQRSSAPAARTNRMPRRPW